MPEFTNPFCGVVPRKLSRNELIRAIRLNIAAEHEAAHIYEAHADATDDALAAEVLRDVAREERVHAGEFQKLLYILEPDEVNCMAEGAEEVQDMAAQFGRGAGGTAPAETADQPTATVGSMRR